MSLRIRNLSVLVTLALAAALLPFVMGAAPLAHADDNRMPSWPPPLDWMPTPGEEQYAHLWGGGWSGLTGDPGLDNEATIAGMPFPSAADLLPPGQEVSPQGSCAPALVDTPYHLIEKRVTPETVTTVAARRGPAMMRVTVSCRYGSEGGDPSRAINVTRSFGIRVLPSKKPTIVAARSQIEAGVGEQVVIEASVLSDLQDGQPPMTVEEGVLDLLDGARRLGSVDLAESPGAVFVVDGLEAGRHELTLDYGGEEEWDPSDHQIVVRVRQPATVTATPNPVPVRPGRPAHFEVRVDSDSASLGPIGGTITLSHHQRGYGQADVRNGVARVELAADDDPPPELRLDYSGDDFTRPAVGAVFTTRGSWLDDVALEERRYGAGEWAPTRTDEDIAVARDGNPTRVGFTLVNPRSQAAHIRYRLTAPDGQTVPGTDGAIQLDGGAEERVAVDLPTSGESYDELGSPRRAARTFSVVIDAPGVGMLDEPLRVRIEPLPVVLVHGWNSNAEGWSLGPPLLRSLHPHLRAHAVGDGSYPGTMDTGDLMQPGPTKSIAENADELATYVDALRRDSGAFQVDLVAHSMGGLISRQYLQHDMPASPYQPDSELPVVRHLVQLGTPNMGSPCANRLIEASVLTGDAGEDYRLPQPSTYQLTTDHAEWFNEHVTQLRGTRLSNLVGTDYQLPCGWPVDSDIVVPVWSARWNIRAFDRAEMPLLHTDMTGDEQAMRTYVLPRLAGHPPLDMAPASSGLDSERGDISPGSEPTQEAGTTFAATTMRLGPDGGSHQVDVPDGHRFGVTGVGAGVRLELVAPDGTVADAGQAVDASVPLVGLDATLSGGSGAAGRWSVRAKPTGTGPTRDVPLVFWVSGSPVVLDEVQGVAAGSEVRLTARLRDDAGPVDATVSAVVTSGERMTAVVAMRDDGRSGDGAAGDGLYGYRGVLDPPTEGAGSVVVRARLADGSSRVVTADLEPGDPGADPVDGPVIVEQPTSARTTVGRPATFTVETAGEVSAVQWQWRGAGGADWRPVRQADDSTLVVVPRHRHLDGRAYRALVTGTPGLEVSTPARLRVGRAATRVAAVIRPRPAGTRAVVRVRVTAPGTTVTPRGSLVVRQEGRAIARAGLAGGRAVLRLPRTAGSIRVVYHGSHDHRPSRSGRVSLRP